MTGNSRRRRTTRRVTGRRQSRVSLAPVKFGQYVMPTAERLKQSGGDVELANVDVEVDGAASMARTHRVSDQGPFDRMKRRRVLSPRQLAAGDRFQKDWWHSGQAQRTTAAYSDAPRSSDPRSGMAATEVQVHVRQRLRAARAVLGNPLDVVLVAILIDELDLVDAGRKHFGRQDASQARASATDILKVGLDTLADHYGL